MFEFGIGVACICYGIYTAIIRVKSPEKLYKYGVMKSRLGDTAGGIVHTFFYTVMPLLFGIIMVVMILKGILRG